MVGGLGGGWLPGLGFVVDEILHNTLPSWVLVGWLVGWVLFMLMALWWCVDVVDVGGGVCVCVLGSNGILVVMVILPKVILSQ